MATLTSHFAHHAPVTANRVERVVSILHWTYGLVPIIAGVDKFMHVLTDWNKYLAPAVTNIIPMSPNAFMSIVGVIEIVAGIIVLAIPRIGSLIVGLWLVAIVINLLLTGHYFDIAVRDAVMATGAFCLYILLNGKDDVHR